MQEQDIKGVLKKVEELKALFTFAVRYTPFLEDLLLFVQEMAPMLHEMSKSIEESSAKMPDAVEQLDKVTSATEIATNEMLDKVDEILIKMDDISEGFNNYLERNKQEQEAIKSIASSIEQLMDLPGIKQKLSQIFEDEGARNIGMSIKSVVDEFLAGRIEDEAGDKILTKVQDAQGDAYDIMNALQVQDITTQQIAAAHGLLRQVQERLNKLIMDYAGTEPPELIREARAHDSNATVFGAHERQEVADNVLQEAMAQAEKSAEESWGKVSKDEESTDSEESIESQDDIDALFAANKAGAAVEEETELEDIAEEEPGIFDEDESSVIDVDSLFDEDVNLDDVDLSSVLPGEEDDIVEEEELTDAPEEDITQFSMDEEPAAEEIVEDEPEDAEPEAEEEDAVTEEDVDAEVAAEDEPVKDQSEDGNRISISQEEIDKLFQ